jgi:hypothetical protein
VSGVGLIVEIKPNAKARREFARYCAARQITVRPLTAGYGQQNDTFCHDSGEERAACPCAKCAAFRRRGRVGTGQTLHHRFECVGSLPVLRALESHPAVASAYHALNVRAPMMGARPEPFAPVPKDIPEATRRAIVSARRESGFAAADRERDRARAAQGTLPEPTAVLAAGCEAFGVAEPGAAADAGELDKQAAIAELIAYAEQGEASLTPAEREWVAVLRARLGI